MRASVAGGSFLVALIALSALAQADPEAGQALPDGGLAAEDGGIARPRPVKWTRKAHPLQDPRVALHVKADSAALEELKNGLERGGVRVVTVPRTQNGPDFMGNADYVVSGTIPNHSPDDRSAPSVELVARMVRSREPAIMENGRLTSAGVAPIAGWIAGAIRTHWKEKARSGLLFSVVSEGATYAQARKLESSLRSTGVVSRVHPLRIVDGKSWLDVTIPGDVSPSELAEVLDGWTVGSSWLRVASVTDEAVFVTFEQEPVSP